MTPRKFARYRSNGSNMKIAIVGSGIAGNVAAYHLRKTHDITVFEAGSYVGGHTNTVDVEENGRHLPIDTGFIVYNDRTYPEFIRLLEELGQPSKRSVMSFSVQNERSGLQYCGSSLNGLFAQRRNAVRPKFWRMVQDILRFNNKAVAALPTEDLEITVGQYLDDEGFSAAFRDDYLAPMAAAIWSAEPGSVTDMPFRFLVRFFHNHGLLQLRDRPVWRVIEGGSREYVRRLVAGHRDRIRLNTPVRSISRSDSSVSIATDQGGRETFDHVFLACHSDQALKLLADANEAEREVLGAIPYQRNKAVLHTDSSLMPAKRRAWAAWNYHVPRNARSQVAVTYHMNALQGLDAGKDYFVTLNHSSAIDPNSVIYATDYEHPVYSVQSVAAQARHRDVNTGNRTSFCGAYWRNGFHEDGVVSALSALQHFEEERHAELHFRRTG